MAEGRGSFVWRSLADLMTGLMLVFLVLMVVLFVQMHSENQKLRRSKTASAGVVEDISRVVTTPRGLARRIQKVLPEHIIDPITAELRVGQEQLDFGRATNTVLDATNLERLRNFGPAYVCSLWASEHEECLEQGQSDCARLDPMRPFGVRRILISGNADLAQKSRDTNLKISSRRALHVQLKLMEMLRTCADSASEAGKCFSEREETRLCREHPDLVWNYAQKRLHAVGAGHLRHCLEDEQARRDGDCEQRSLKTKAGVESYRTVNFHFELSNADPTSLILDISDLEFQLQSESQMSQLVTEISQLCWEGNDHYAVCHGLAERCRELSEGVAAWEDTSAGAGPSDPYRCRDYGTYCEREPRPALCPELP